MIESANMLVTIHPTFCEDFIVRVDNRHVCAIIAFEREIEPEFNRFPPRLRYTPEVQEAKAVVRRLLKLLEEERPVDSGAAHRAFKRMFPNGYSPS